MRDKLRLLGIAILLALVVLSPYIAWHLQSGRLLEVVIVDKTVPFEIYREHAAIPWILRAMKIRGTNGKFLDTRTDYIGFDPRTKKGSEITSERLKHTDVLVVTDTYGVYEGDYKGKKEETALERSPKIYGGLDDAEATAIEAFSNAGGLVVAEFSTFGSPTPASARDRLERLFGVKWNQWVARYWPNPQDKNEVPGWVGRVWESITHTPFDMKGGGLVFVREDHDIVVLLASEDLTAEVVTQQRTTQGAAFDFPERGAYTFWMDVVEATDGEVLYDHVVGATPTGVAKLSEHGLKVRFPALVKRKDNWYFAGDFVDTGITLGTPEIVGLLEWKAHTSGWGGGTKDDAGFFWGFYVPIVSRVLGARAR